MPGQVSRPLPVFTRRPVPVERLTQILLRISSQQRNAILDQGFGLLHGPIRICFYFSLNGCFGGRPGAVRPWLEEDAGKLMTLRPELTADRFPTLRCEQLATFLDHFISA